MRRRTGSSPVPAAEPGAADLDRLEVTARRNGSDLLIEAPSEHVRRRRIDLTVSLPADLPVGVTDGSGSLDTRGVAAVRLDDGSGGIDVADVDGDFIVRAAGSGGVRSRRVAGQVSVPCD